MRQHLQRWGVPRPVRWLAAVAWLLFLALLLVRTEEQTAAITHIQPAPPSLEREIFFTLSHVGGFFILAGLWWWALRPHFKKPERVFIWMSIITLVFGAVTEYAQNFVPTRGATWVDFLANVAGVLLFIVLVRFWQRKHAV